MIWITIILYFFMFLSVLVTIGSLLFLYFLLDLLNT